MRMEFWKVGISEFRIVGLLILSLGMAAQAQHECTNPNCTSCASAAPVETAVVPVVEAHDDHAGHDHEEDEGQTGVSSPPVEQTLLSAHSEHEEDGQDDHVDELVGCDHGQDEHADAGVDLSSEMMQRVGIQVRAATGGSVATSMVFPAEIYLNRDRAAAVSPRYASVIRQVFAEIGDEVKKGDVLASLESRETLAVYTVSAPLDGVVVAKDASVGESALEDRVLFEVADLSSVWADISIFPNVQHLIAKGMPVEFTAHDGHAARGTVKYVSPLVSHETRTLTARCVLKGAADDFTPGAFVRARIVTASVAVSVRVEREAIQKVAGESVVFISDEHGFETRVVETGLSNDRFVEIKSGLEPGEQYVSAGAFALKAEMLTSGMDPHAGHGH